MKFTKTKIFTLVLLVFLFSFLVVFAHDNDLGVSDPFLLPDSHFYFLKEWQRSIVSFFTFNKISKAERQLRYANERLIEAKKLAEKIGSEEIVMRAMEKFQKTQEQVVKRLENLKEKYKEHPRFQKLMETFADNGIKQQRVISLISDKFKNAPGDMQERLENIQERIINKWEETSDIKEIINNFDDDSSENRDNSEKICKDLCGDNVCQEIVCMGTGCPCPETTISCPVDCS